MPDVLQFKIHGMDCAEEVGILKRELRDLVGDESNLSFDILNSRMTLRNTGHLSAQQVIESVAKTGMTAELWAGPGPSERQAETRSWWRDARTVATVLSGSLVVVGFCAHAVLSGSLLTALSSEHAGAGGMTPVPLPVRVLYLLAVLAGAWYVLPKAWLSLRRLRPDMNLLMTVAVIGAVALGQWLEAATVSFLFALSLALESWSVGRARRAVEALMKIAPESVGVLESDGTIRETPSASVPVGTLFRVKPGERIGLDGTVVEGTSDVNQAPITGESLPITKEPGAAVFAGTINGNGVIDVRSTKSANDTTLAHVIRLVAESQGRRSPAEQWVNRFALIYTPTVFAVAILTALVPPLLFHQPWATWIYQSLVLLVIGCPCALVISTPVSIVAGLAAAARNGVLVKGGLALETPARLKAIAMDKTGTLTEGKPSVAKVVALNGHTEQELLERAGSLESSSQHPLARAICDYVSARGLQPGPVTEFTLIPGKGATARLDGRSFWLGSHRFLEERGQETPEVHSLLSELSGAGHSVVVIGNETHVCGFIALADRLRPGIPELLAATRALGVPHVVMLTGDNEGTARTIARQAGIEEVRAELLPADKVAAIEALVQQYESVAMIGDGVNDAPAMARASLGIAMGAIGSDAAIEAADVALMSDDLHQLPWLIGHSRRTLSIIRQNIFLSLAVKFVFVALTFAGHGSLWAAIAADMGVSLLVIFNALRLLQSKP
ncbi:MAG: heavy metal translocating P-type ATPase [Acidobacteria bacterium]|nr:heavy metal translocating P-type ATPase [Acidobacteriota bacterium]